MSVLAFIDRLRLRKAPLQVQEAYRLYRDMRYSGMVVGSAAGHAPPQRKAVVRLLRQIRKADPRDTERLDGILSDIRAQHAEFLASASSSWG